MRTRWLNVGAIVTAATTVVLWLLIGGDHSSAPVVKLPDALPIAENEHKTMHATETPTRQTAPWNAKVGSESLDQQLLRATDYRAFAVEALNHPERGGRYFASWVLNVCGLDNAHLYQRMKESNASALATTGTVDQRQLSAQALFLQRCSGLSRYEAMSMYQRIQAESTDGRDPVWESIKEIRLGYSTPDSAVFQAGLRHLLASGVLFPLTDENLGLTSQVGQNERARFGQRWFDGKNWTAVENHFSADQYDLAFTLAACDIDSWCGIDQQMLLMCAVRGICLSDHTEFMIYMNKAQGGGVEELDRIRNLSIRLHDSLQSQDVRAFLIVQ